MKKSQLKKLIREMIKEQQPGPNADAITSFVDDMQTVGAKGCCPQLYMILDFISSHQTNINNINSLIQSNTYGSTESPTQMQVFTNSIEMAQNAMNNGVELYNSIHSTGCCKELRGKGKGN